MLSLEILEHRHLLSASPLISEFMASNSTTLFDGDGESSDWIEIYNPTTATVDLAGWHLTDDEQSPAKWTFPAAPQTVLEPGGYLVVFASGQPTDDYVDADGRLHANFGLSADGEYLALTDAANTVVHEFAPEYPAQRTDVSYGVNENVNALELVGPASPMTALLPVNGALDAPSVGVPPAWTLNSFNDAGWLTSSGSGLGYDVGNAPPPNIPNGTLLSEGLIGGDFTDPEENGVVNGTISAGGFPGSPTNEEPDKALDNSTATKWLAFMPAGTYYEFQFDDNVKQVVSAYTITSANDAEDRDPYSWTLSGSNDGNNYTVIDTRTAQNFAGRFETRLYEFENYVAYEYYRFDLQTEFGVTGQNQPVAIQVAEFELLTNGAVDFTPLVDLNVASQWNSNPTSVYQRIDFDVADPAALGSLTLDMQYDDGFVAYLNGVRVASAAAPALPNYQSHATENRDDNLAVQPQKFNLTPYLNSLVAGTNVLAIHALNITDVSSDLLSVPRLTATELVDDTLALEYMPNPTPGAPNSEGYAGIVATPTLSVPHGFYSAPFQLSIDSGVSPGDVYYTTDGSAPSPTNGSLYSAPITVSATTTIRVQAFHDGYLPSSPATSSYFFVDDIVQQTYLNTLNKGFPANWGPFSADYGLDPDVIGNFNSSGVSIGGDKYGGIYAATIKDDLQAIPTMSLVMDVDDLFGPTGIYTNSTASGSAWERAVSVEYIDPATGEEFQIDAGVRMHGGAFRNDSLSKKHSMRLVFKGIYEGNTKLDFPLFGNDAASSFDTIVLRMDSNDGYAWDAAGAKAQYARNAFGNESQLALGQPSSHHSRVHLYINGVYWGLYTPVERPDDSFAASYFGGAKDDWDAINSGAINSGTMDAWNTLVSLSHAVGSASSQSAKTAAYMQVLGLNPDGSDNPALATYLDATNYIDYLMLNFYMGNVDWPHRNWWAVRENVPDSTGFKFISWDTETALGLGSSVTTNRTGVSEGAAIPYSSLKSSEEFRIAFADRVHRAFFNDGPLSTAKSVARYLDITDEIAEAIVAESARWGDMHYSTPLVETQWINEIGNVLGFLNNRQSIFLNQLRSAGLYSNVTAPTFSQFGGQVPAGYDLTMSAPAGAIWYTTDGSDPRAIGGAVSATAQLYNGTPVDIVGAVQVRARALSGGVWSAANEAEFTSVAPADASNLRLVEFHYNPAPQAGVADEQSLEFIELLNPSNQPVSLDGVQIAQFASTPYSFPAGIELAAGARIVVAKDPVAFAAVYGAGVNLAPQGYGSASLSNGGERIALLGAQGQTIQDFTYDDSFPWPAVADGGGHSVEIVDPFADPAAGANWRASYYRGGSPGTSGEGPAVPGDFDGDADVDGGDFLIWQRGFGAAQLTATAADGDADADRDVDGADLAQWGASFGTTLAPAVAAAFSDQAAEAIEASRQSDFAGIALLMDDDAIAQDAWRDEAVFNGPHQDGMERGLSRSLTGESSPRPQTPRREEAQRRSGATRHRAAFDLALTHFGESWVARRNSGPADGMISGNE
ncbi:MAG: lamin tail domain-containing protein [Planctomycetales bacterium]|nr:lamin tail domain-containing protein [Planctomycetales bacterium]